MSDTETLTYIWAEDDTGQRPDKVLAQRLDLSRTQLQQWLKEGLVSANGQKIEAKARLQVGDSIAIQRPQPKPMDLVPEARPLDIIYEDEDFLALNKKPGEIVHPGAGVRQGTLVSALLHHCQGQLSGIGGVERPGIVHRLDKDTSGILLVAKNDLTHQGLAHQFEQRLLRKIYWAYVLGKPRLPVGTWAWNIGRNPVQRQKMSALPSGGREARTDYKLLQAHTRASLLQLRLHTGRTHQIRVHAQKAGHPVVGDTVYGGNAPWIRQAGVARQLLHARALELEHPRTQKVMELIAPEPQDFVEFSRKLSK